MNTRAYKSLAYGAGLLPEGAVGVPTEFIIQARNDLGENRKSGRDNFQVKIVKADTNEEIPSEVVDKNDGQYLVKYQVEEECEVKVDIFFEDDKGKMVMLRGCPYKASFSAKTPATANNLTGPAMGKYIVSGLEDIHNFISETSKGANTKEKNIYDVKTLISVKDHVENVFLLNDEMVLKLDCLDESLKMFHEHQIAKDSQLKQIKKLHEEWTGLKKLAKESKKEISPLVQVENEKTISMIKKFEDDLKQFNAELKKRDFYTYNTGVDEAKNKLNTIDEETKFFDEQIVDYGYNANKFGNSDLISNSLKQIDAIKVEIQNMSDLWDHIEKC